MSGNGEYISREAAIDDISSLLNLTDLEGNPVNAKDIRAYVAELINHVPAADVRPVVLCKDCDCWNDWDSAGKESLGNYVCSCAHWSVEDGPVLFTRPDDFCSYGEKREES